jgi:hypothetical protein
MGLMGLVTIPEVLSLDYLLLKVMDFLVLDLEVGPVVGEFGLVRVFLYLVIKLLD